MATIETHEWNAIEGSDKTSACFDCNICLDFACDPVVTLCGHLYCWPCIYKWFHIQSCSDEHLCCPVCKTELSDTSVVPLYGSGKLLPKSDPEAKLSSVKVPPRPPACAQPLPSPNSQQLSYHTQHEYAYPRVGPNSPVAGMFGEMVYARVFGNSQSLYAYPNSYQFVGNSSSRVRRQEMEVDKSLNRISLFLFCCFFLCLLLF